MASSFMSRKPYESSRGVIALALVLVVMVVVVLTRGCSCSHVTEEVKVQSEKEAKEASETWTEWATDKISQTLGPSKQDQDKDTAKKASDSAAETAKKAASGY